MIPGDVYEEKKKSDKEKGALEALFPSPNDLPDAIKLIGTFKGQAPTIPALYEARIVYTFLDIMDGKKIEQKTWDELNMSKFYEERTPGLGGKHADRAVDIARAGPKQGELPLSWLDRMLGREK